MKTLKVRSIGRGKARAQALVTSQAINFAASYITLWNVLFPSRIHDRHHELYRRDVRGKVLVMPTCVGSTYSGIVLQGLITRGHAPAAIVVQDADSYVVSGLVLAEAWFSGSLPVVEYTGKDLFELVKTGDLVEVDADRGEIVIDRD